MSLTPLSYTVKHEFYPPVVVTLPIKWDMDPYGTNNWKHEFLSFRWIDIGIDISRLHCLLTDFIDYHIISNYPNPFYNSKLGDHATVCRLKWLLECRRKILKAGNETVPVLIDKILRYDVQSLQDEKNYSSGHNHGLMADVALLKCYIEIEPFRRDIKISSIVKRALKTLYHMFSPETGITKEHSIFYQVFNFVILKQLHDSIASAHDLDANIDISPVREFYIKVKEASKQLASMSLRANHMYFPAGDTKIFPNWGALGTIFNCEPEASQVLLNAAIFRSEHPFCLFKEGFCFFRGFSDAGNDQYNQVEPHQKNQEFFESSIDLVFLCGWHSWAHKQDDELSFILDYRGVNFFDDGGYNGFLKSDELIMLKDAHHHSTITIEPIQWSKRNKPDRRNFIDGHLIGNCCYMHGEHRRINGYRVGRKIFIYKDSVFIADYVDPLTDMPSRHRFILGQNVEISSVIYNDESLSVALAKDGFNCKIHCVSGQCKMQRSDIFVVAGNDLRLTNRTVLDFSTTSQFRNRICFFITFDGATLGDFKSMFEQKMFDS